MARYSEVGDRATDFTLPTTHGTISLSKYLEGGPVLLVFYPRNDSLLSARQLCNYSDQFQIFQELGVQLLAISGDSLTATCSHSAKYNYPFPLASDSHLSTCRAYGVLSESWRPKRALVFVGADGRIRWRRSGYRFIRPSATRVGNAISRLWKNQPAAPADPWLSSPAVEFDSRGVSQELSSS